ncbi:MAG: hypothetical protein PHV28_12675 [Kiritimatiellae bacterium]|nr:hypothetical protein [Kiritimatiellia bacterium]
MLSISTHTNILGKQQFQTLASDKPHHQENLLFDTTPALHIAIIAKSVYNEQPVITDGDKEPPNKPE